MKKLNFDILTLLKKHCDVTKTLEHCYKKMNVDKNCAVAKKILTLYQNIGELLQKDETLWKNIYLLPKNSDAVTKTLERCYKKMKSEEE